MNEEQRQTKKKRNGDCSSVVTHLTKRVRYDVDTGVPTARGKLQTVQDCLEGAIGNWTGQSVDDLLLRFAGRTDKGVSARGQVVTVNLNLDGAIGGDRDRTSTAPSSREVCRDIVSSMNSRLPIDISVLKAESLRENPSFNPRHDAKSKTYSYTIKYRRRITRNGRDIDGYRRSGPNSFRNALDTPVLWNVPWPLDDGLLLRRDELPRALQGVRDFSNFVHKSDRDSGRDHAVDLRVFRFDVLSEEEGEEEEEEEEGGPGSVVTARFTLESKGFRRSMVRKIVGFCVDVCRDYKDLTDFVEWDATAEEAKDFIDDGGDATPGATAAKASVWTFSELVASKIQTAPASGLCLEVVKY